VDLSTVATTVDIGVFDRVTSGSSQDATGDGRRDLLFTTGREVFLFKGPFRPGTLREVDATLRIRPSSDAYARGAADVADFDDDGAAEIVVATDCARGGGSSRDDVNIAGIDGSRTGTVDLSDRNAMKFWIACSSAADEVFKASVVGDVNGDGQADLGVASHYGWYIIAGPLVGQIDPTTASALVSWETHHPDFVVRAPGRIGDLDGDGADEFFALTKGPFRIGDTEPDGALHIIRSGHRGLLDPADAASVWVGQPIDSILNMTVAGGGDVDGDGLFDLIVGAPDYQRSEPHPGHVYWFSGASLLASP
jgi:hypothetical protein